MRALRVVLALLVSLGGLAWGASAIVDRMGRHWWEKDVTLRAQLAVRGASETILRHWQRGDIGGLSAALERLARDERIMGAAACGRDGRLITATDDLPPRF